MWLIYAPGSGIYFNLGVTISFAEHQDAYTHFNIAGGQDMNEALSKAAAAAGYDSIQFLAHVDVRAHAHVWRPCMQCVLPSRVRGFLSSLGETANSPCVPAHWPNRFRGPKRQDPRTRGMGTRDSIDGMDDDCWLMIDD